MALFVLAFFAPFEASASSVLPSTAELPRLQDMLDRMPMPTKAPTLIQEPSTTLPAAADEDVAERVRFTLKTLTINGVTAYAPEELMSLFQDMTGQESSVAEIYRLATAITNHYRNAGYILARAIIPPQEITKGHVTLNVVEGTINNIILVGDAGLKNSPIIEAHAEALQNAKGAFNSFTAEEHLLRMNDLPGVVAQSTLKSSESPGQSDLVIHLAREDYAGSVGWNNWGTRYLGPAQLEGELVFNNILPRLTGTDSFHDGLRIRGIHTTNLDELGFLDVTYSMPINDLGTTLSFGHHRSISRPGFGLDALDINSRSSGWTLKARHPLKRTRAASHYAFGQFDMKKTNVTTLGATTSEDKLSVARAGIEGTVADKAAGINTYKLEVSRGLGVFGASEKGDALLSRQRGVADGFYKAKFDVARLQRLNNSINLLVAGSGQFATHALLAAEEFGLGGENYGRGYDNSELIGDHGAAVKAELQYNFELGDGLIPQWQLFLFQDFGAIWNKDLGFGDEGGAKTLASNGFGVRAPIGKTMTFDFTLANPRTIPVASQGESGKNPTAYFRLKKYFSSGGGQ